MATFTPTLTLTTSGLTSNDLSFSVTTSPTVTDTTGLQRKTLTSVSKTNRITCLAGNTAIADSTVHEGQFIDITDNHGLKKRYVFVDGTESSVATGAIIAGGSDLGSDTALELGLLQTVGGIAVDVPNGTTQAATLNLFKAAIVHANGHNGSIAVASATVASGVQEIVLTNPTAGESGAFLVDIDNSTITVFLDNTKDAEATNSASDHPILVDKSEFLAPAFVYIKNTAAYHATAGRVFCYYDNHGAEDIMEIRGGHFAFVPLSPNNNLKAYTSTSGTIVEYMVIGDDA